MQSFRNHPSSHPFIPLSSLRGMIPRTEKNHPSRDDFFKSHPSRDDFSRSHPLRDEWLQKPSFRIQYVTLLQISSSIVQTSSRNYFSCPRHFDNFIGAVMKSEPDEAAQGCTLFYSPVLTFSCISACPSRPVSSHEYLVSFRVTSFLTSGLLRRLHFAF